MYAILGVLLCMCIFLNVCIYVAKKGFDNDAGNDNGSELGTVTTP